MALRRALLLAMAICPLRKSSVTRLACRLSNPSRPGAPRCTPSNTGASISSIVPPANPSRGTATVVASDRPVMLMMVTLVRAGRASRSARSRAITVRCDPVSMMKFHGPLPSIWMGIVTRASSEGPVRTTAGGMSGSSAGTSCAASGIQAVASPIASPAKRTARSPARCRLMSASFPLILWSSYSMNPGHRASATLGPESPPRRAFRTRLAHSCLDLAGRASLNARTIDLAC